MWGYPHERKHTGSKEKEQTTPHENLETTPIKVVKTTQTIQKKVGTQDNILNSKFAEELRHNWKSDASKWRSVKHIVTKVGWDQTHEQPKEAKATTAWWSAKNPRNWWNNKARLKQKKRAGKNDYMKWTWDHKPEANIGANGFKIASFNVQGTNMGGKRQEIETWMEHRHIDVLCLQESKNNCNATESRRGFTWYFSSSIKDADRDKIKKIRESGKKPPPQLVNKTTQKRGVAMVLSKRAEAALIRITAHGSNNMTGLFRGKTNILIHNTYQPHAGEKDKDLKDAEYHKMHAIRTHESRQNQAYFLAGDFNARILKACGLKTECFGKHFLKSHKSIEELGQEVWDNRERFVNYVQENNLVVHNTRFQKTKRKICTYHNKHGDHKGGGPWDAKNYGQLDFVITEQRWKNAVKDVWSDTHCWVSSDHFPIIAKIHIKFAKKDKTPSKQKVVKVDHWKTKCENPEKVKAFNESVSRCLDQEEFCRGR